MKVWGTVTSPFVRRVRVVAAEVGEPVELVDVNAPEGQASLRAASPIWKVPTAELAGRVLWDSAIIIDALLERGSSTFRTQTSLEERMFVAAVDEATLSLVRLFYLRKDGIDVTKPSFLVKEQARADSALAWIAARVPADGFGRAELALYTSLEWMRFRAVFDVTKHATLVAFLDAHKARPSLATTAPT